MEICLTFILLSSTLTLTAADSVRLVNGGSHCAGRVEVLHDGQWGTVCHYHWDMRDAAVVCKELNCGEPVNVRYSAHFGPGSGPIWMDNVQCSGSESTLKNCSSHGWGKHYCDHLGDSGVTCSDHEAENSDDTITADRKTVILTDSVRLVNGGSRCAGRVEVLHDGQWGTVCSSAWDMKDAAVVCRELRCGEAVEISYWAEFGRGSGPIWIYDLYCRGSELTLNNCSSKGGHYCDHREDAGVICSGQSLRLTAGPHRCSGRVEVFHGGSWSTVCDADFDQQDAEVVCRELDCGIPVEVLGSAAFGRGEGQVWTEELQCRGTESDITFCPTSSSLKHSHCSHDNDVGLICHTEARLVNGPDSCSGRVELQYLGEWGTVCAVGWDMRAADVLCAQLDCGSAVAVVEVDWFGEGSGHIWADVFDCQGKETHLSRCGVSSWSRAACSHKHDAGVICNGVRLVGSGGDCAGRLEVFHSGSWGTVCDDSWDIEDAQVVCRQLQCGVALSTHIPAWFGPGTGSIWLNEVECEGNETSLWNCRFQLCEEGECGHHEDVGVVCSGTVLSGGKGSCSGRLEVYHNSTWGSVCDDQWNIRNAQVVCRQLGCGSAVNVRYVAHFGNGSGPIWLDEVDCNGSESTLKDCGSAEWGETDCDHDEDAGVTCSDSVRLVNGGSRCAGRVEVLHDGQWGTVCSSAWDMKDAAVLCRELRCGEAVEIRYQADFGRGSGEIWIRDVYCRGSELTLNNCSSQGKHDCDHGDDAGVTCSGHIKPRLTAGPHRCSGRVEVFHGGSWSTVCDADFDQQDAEVVCRELDCGIPVKVLGSAAFGRGEGQVWTEELQCRGTESDITFCPTSSSLKHSHCSHDNDVGLICSGHTEARLVNGPDSCSGRVELQYLGEWGTVCAVGWDMRAADVLCAQLDCGSAVAVVEVDWFGEGSGHIWADVFDCQGKETHLSRCGVSSWSRAACSHKHDAGVICNGSSMVFHEGRVRLSGGRECQGEVEIYFRQHWRRVLLDSWSLSEASVLCRQLGCGSVLNYRSSPSTTEHKHMCVTGFSCSGSEDHLGNCSRPQAEPVNCSSGEQLYITCSEFKEIRLSEGCEGNLEVFYNGTWGNVCYNQMDDETVNMVCRELNCGRRGSLSNTEARVKSAPNWLDELKCRKHDSNLWQCPSSPWGQNRCDNRDEVARITCTGGWIQTFLVLYIECSSLPSQKHCSKHWSLRLSGGKGSCSGRLEVYHNSTWGSVCDDRWNIRNAQVVCRQLGCGSALSADRNVWLGSGEGTIWMNRVKCRGDEIHLWDCHHSLKNHTDCSHAGVTCAGQRGVLTFQLSVSVIRLDNFYLES
ncbi:deleted in malignant brain tumors 1 protein-like [Hemibagrus wyckioides]|uniref:deleted in malignant brain tumors 1 protein-like n=1 Tax=Hemibagrus wyckioides TaxID=337641 RepID=UPI00266D113E|nr:deleted in malignant brain tumors 1 protein-like [Hemibagrus wyckioides]